jgi:hypothetical protein
MNKKVITLLNCAVIVFAFLVTGCSSEQTQPKMSFGCNIETAYWKNLSVAYKFPNAHSGNYVSKLNKDSPYSAALDIPVNEISSKPLKRAKITAWFFLTSHTTVQNLVCDIRDSTMQNSIEWIGIDAADFSNELNKWAKAELTIDLTKNNRNNSSYVYRIYAFNDKDETVYADDFDVSFED